MSTVARRDYVYELFDRQCEIALQNLARLYAVVGDKVDVVYITGTDFGTQNSQFLSAKAYRDLYKPFHRRVNDWVHANTTWKTFMHTDGALMPLIPDFIDAGFDILQPIQFTAKDMDPATLKAQFGDKLVFWGGGIDTQRVLPFGTPDEVRAQVREKVKRLLARRRLCLRHGPQCPAADAGGEPGRHVRRRGRIPLADRLTHSRKEHKGPIDHRRESKGQKKSKSALRLLCSLWQTFLFLLRLRVSFPLCLVLAIASGSWGGVVYCQDCLPITDRRRSLVRLHPTVRKRLCRKNSRT